MGFLVVLKTAFLVSTERAYHGYVKHQTVCNYKIPNIWGEHKFQLFLERLKNK